MKRTIIASLVFASFTCFSADHAVLNVEGEIQINGKTVIDQNGLLTGTAQSNAQVVNLDDYEQAVGTYNYTEDRSWSDPYGETWANESCDITEVITEERVNYTAKCNSERFGSYSYLNENYNPDFVSYYDRSQEEWDQCSEVQCTQEDIWDDSTSEYVPNPDYDPYFLGPVTDEERQACYAVQCDQEYLGSEEPAMIIGESTDIDEVIKTEVGEDYSSSYSSVEKLKETGEVVYTYSSDENTSFAIEELSSNDNYYTIGTNKSTTALITVLSTTDSYREQGDKYFYHTEHEYSDIFKDITVNGKYYSDCLVSNINYNDGNLSLKCHDNGWLSVSPDDEISFGAQSAQFSLMGGTDVSIQNKTTRKNYDLIRQMRNDKRSQFREEARK